MGKDGTTFLMNCHELMYLSVLSACQALYGCSEVPNTFTIWTLCQHALLGTEWQTHTDTHWDRTCELSLQVARPCPQSGEFISSSTDTDMIYCIATNHRFSNHNALLRCTRCTDFNPTSSRAQTLP